MSTLRVPRAFSCDGDCYRTVIVIDDFKTSEYLDDEWEEFIEDCVFHGIPVTSDGIVEDNGGFCNWCELTQN